MESITNVEHLPQLIPLLGFNEDNWKVFGTLTLKYNTAQVEYVPLFKELLQVVAQQNGADYKRLHWIMRIEGGHDGKRLCSDHGLAPRHMHYLLAGDRVTNGYKKQFEVMELCQFLTNHWPYGISEHSPFIAGRNGLKYVLKCPFGVESVEYEDYVEISPRLTTLLKQQAQEAA